MYNLFQATKIKQQLHRRRIKSQKQQKWLNKYNQQTQPQLIQSYNKRINHFVRKIQQKPVVIKQFIQYQPNKVFRSNITKQGCLGEEYFKYKDKNDWNSIYTQLERTQMERNSKIMEKLFGDSSLAYRSIISQSEYKKQKQQNFRQRVKLKQINPPMKYTFITPQIMIRKYSNKDKNNNIIKMKTQQSQKQHKNNTNNNNTSTINRNNSFNLLFDQQNHSSQSFRTIPSLSQSMATTNSKFQRVKHQNQQQQKKQQKQYISEKLHFKTIRQTFQKTKDIKVKSNIKELLVKCNIIKSKDKKITKQEESDGLLTMDNTEHFRNNNITQNSYIHVYHHQHK